MSQTFKYLSEEQQQHFLERGWVKIPGGIPPQNIELFADNIWTRLGYDPNDKDTWVKEYVHMPRHREIPTKEFAPAAYNAMCELVGGEDRLDPGLFTKSGDSIICNFGTEHWTTHELHPREFTNWHIDGDWFTHFLDSGDQGLVVIQLFTDIEPRAGGTYICEDGLPLMVKWLHDHPQGTNMRDGPNGEQAYDVIKDCKVFTELTGNTGDVILIHPFMPHSASKNHLRHPRFITNPPITLKEPLNFERPDPKDFSLVERVILRALGKPSLPSSEWHITVPRIRFFPRTQAAKLAMVKDELERMIKAAEQEGKGPESIDSVHLHGGTLEQWKLGAPPPGVKAGITA